MTNVARYKLPLTQGQEDIFFDQLHHGPSAMYSIGGKIRLVNIDVECLQDAHTKLVNQHPMFKLRVHVNGDILEQSFDGEVNNLLSVLDFTGELSPEQRAQSWVNQYFQRYIAFSEQSLWSACLLRVHENVYWYVGVAHHIINDGFGFANWVKSLSEFYNGAKVTASNLDDWHYIVKKDLAYRSSKRYIDDKAFWCAQLSQLPPSLFSILPNASQIRKSCRLVVKLDNSEYPALLQHSDIKDNAHCFFLAALAIYFSLFARQTHLNVGVPTHNRRGDAEKSALGLHINVNVLNLEIQPAYTFWQVLEQVSAKLRCTMRHRHFPVGQVSRALSTTHLGLYSLGFSFLQVDGGIEFGEEAAEYEYESNFSQQLPLNLTVWQVKGKSTELQFDYCLKYFTEQDMCLHKDRFLSLLSQISAIPDSPVSNLVLRSAADRQLLSLWNATGKNFGQATTIIDLFLSQYLQAPMQTALIADGAVLSYRQLHSLVQHFANYLFKQGVREGDLVGIYLPRGVAVVVSQLAVLLLGAAFVPLDPVYPKARLAYMVAHAELRFIVTVTALSKDFVATHSIDYQQALDCLHEQQDILPIYPKTSKVAGTAYVIYTSGSTGYPKGVTVSHAALLNFMQAMSLATPLKPGENFLALTPISFDISIMELLWPLTAGAQVTIFQQPIREAINQLAVLLDSGNIDRVQLTPSSWKLLLSSGWQGNRKLIAYSGGESLPLDLATSLTAKVAKLWNMYGPTEATIWATIAQVKDSVDYNSIGTPLANIRAYILDEHLRPLPIGSAGDLYLSGAGLSNGYMFNPEKTAAAFIQAYIDEQSEIIYKTGDIVRWHPDGVLEYLGRSDKQIKLNGYRIEPEEIDLALKSFKAVRDAVSVLITLDDQTSFLCSYYVSDKELCISEVKQHLAQKLPLYMVPSRFVYLKELPLTPSGKTDMGALPLPLMPVAATANSDDASRIDNKVASTIYEIVSSVIANKTFGQDENFFDVGASSNDMLLIVAQVNKVLEQEVSVLDLFQYPSISKLTSYLASKVLHQHASATLNNRRINRAELHNKRQRRKSINE